MTLGKWAVRIVCLVGGLFLAFVLLTFLAVQIQQRMLRWRAERLLADMHQIRLYQSTWADAQRLMHRWGAWGYYDGSCTAASCKYEIELASIASYSRHVSHAWLIWLLRHDRLNLYQWFGGRVSVFHASFTVRDGTIWRESTAMAVSVPRKRMKRVTNADTILTFDDFDWTLSVGAGSYQRLHRTLENWFLFMGGDESLAGHPYYKVGRPGGCKVLCQIVSVYYSTRTPPAEIERLTSYDFSCFTRFHPCARIVDLLPAAEEWHLYDSEYESGPTVPFPKERPLSEYSEPKPIPCSKIPVWAQARDARYVLSVEALSTKIVKNQEDDRKYRKAATVRVVNSLKEPAPWLPGTIVSTNDLYWEIDDLPSSEAEHMVPGRRYIVFAIGNDDRTQLVTKDSPLSFGRCGVRKDTPEVRRELEKGFAQNDTLNP
ncbi:hypothetical protein [Edaphobacter albus]|uniref:hypothetical protein n=1 Tax=Edaphobacter sp. 4G125 TaxID=2763071 RepID=UPI001646209D|nr:hypothetical protein [Edaphobacter sp. 4G125]QNI37445.1 hypothetical protein H7846_03805 [Edaphobacter sp. 4G125]